MHYATVHAHAAKVAAGRKCLGCDAVVTKTNGVWTTAHGGTRCNGVSAGHVAGLTV
jgi:hypothetical protein